MDIQEHPDGMMMIKKLKTKVSKNQQAWTRFRAPGFF